MQFDPNNKVIQLCTQGMNLEVEGKTEEALDLFQEAWNAATTDFEAFTAAHYMARLQKEPADTLQWNMEALNRASALKDEDMKAYYPSLYLNVAKSYETLNDNSEAVKYYQLALKSADNLPIGKYGEMIRSGISEGLKRTNSVSQENELNIKLADLIVKWCEQKNLKPLALILPAYVGNLGSENDTIKLISALSFLSATRCLNNGEQQIVERLIAEYSKK